MYYVCIMYVCVCVCIYIYNVYVYVYICIHIYSSGSFWEPPTFSMTHHSHISSLFLPDVPVIVDIFIVVNSDTNMDS